MNGRTEDEQKTTEEEQGRETERDGTIGRENRETRKDTKKGEKTQVIQNVEEKHQLQD